MEIYRNAVNVVSFTLPTSDTSVAGATVSGLPDVTDGTGLSVSAVLNGRVTAPLPYIPLEGRVIVAWTFTVPGSGTYTHLDSYNIVTPYLSIEEVKEILPNASDKEARAAEKGARLIIDTFCGQSFGYSLKTLPVRGRGGEVLNLKERLDAFTSFTAGTDPIVINSGVLIQEDGWQLRKIGYSDYDGIGVYTNPIHIPGTYRSGYSDSVVYNITGYWGYPNVPENVVEAAKLLVNDYACGEGLYRDRYLESVTAVDFRLQYNAGAYERTGNVRADQLLSDYRRPSWAVV